MAFLLLPESLIYRTTDNIGQQVKHYFPKRGDEIFYTRRSIQ